MRLSSLVQWLACTALLAWPGLGLGAQDTTVVVLRHAERVSLEDSASLLSEVGHARARQLVLQLEAFHPAALYASDLERTQQTLAPLAAKLRVPVLIHSRRDSEGLAAEILRTRRGSTSVVCWHHDLTPRFVHALGVPDPLPGLSFDDYGWLWIVRVPARGAPTLEARRQSAPAAAAMPQGR